jgi:hypothetical protein
LGAAESALSSQWMIREDPSPRPPYLSYWLDSSVVLVFVEQFAGIVVWISDSAVDDVASPFARFAAGKSSTRPAAETALLADAPVWPWLLKGLLVTDALVLGGEN